MINEKIISFYTDVQAYVAPNMNNPRRKFHNLKHCDRMLQFYSDNQLAIGKEEIIAIFFHDYIYVVGSKTNEEDSVKEALRYIQSRLSKTTHDVNSKLVTDMILATRVPFCFDRDMPERIRHFVHADWNGVMHWNSLTPERIQFLNEWEDGIAEEYSGFVDTATYIKGRWEFLTTAHINHFLSSDVFMYMCTQLNAKLDSLKGQNWPTLSPLKNPIPNFENKELTPTNPEGTTMNTSTQNFDNVKSYICNTVREKGLSFSEDEMGRIQSFIEQMLTAADDAVKNKHVVYVCACIHNSALSATYQQTEALVKEIAAKVRENHNNSVEEPAKRITAIDKFIRPKDPDHPDFMVFRLFIIPDQVMDQVMGVYDFDLAA